MLGDFIQGREKVIEDPFYVSVKMKLQFFFSLITYISPKLNSLNFNINLKSFLLLHVTINMSRLAFECNINCFANLNQLIKIRQPMFSVS